MRVLALSLITAVVSLACASPPNQPNKTSPLQGERHSAAPPLAASTDGLQSGELFEVLAQMDRALFEASFETCDAAKANAFFADDVEFYHDQTGLAVAEQVRENTRRLTASCPSHRGVKRTLVPGSLRVYPIHNYGAAQIGMHRFDERGASTSSLAKFVNLWRLQDGRWRLARVLSLDHRAVPPLAPMPAN
ncbi:nuclear transport factor 2 family protein [Paucibacter sp. KCTC 42545]|uniref:nuclear transport factor 2 family protein n=1 Tax=Paucibacter sp. KCTC 42545 TaxID=1768242 RepID=UPI0009E8014E|nr:nuclear transport factor 2 family protein [Paucibacter sp. KCTC 42545]